MKFIRLEIEKRLFNQLGFVYVSPRHIVAFQPNHDNTQTLVSLATGDTRSSMLVYPAPYEVFMQVLEVTE